MTRTIEFYFDFPSPYSYLAHTQLPKIAAEHGATVTYHPFRILELMTIVGNRPTTIECKNKGKYAGVDLQRWTKRYNVDFSRNPHSKVVRLRRTRLRGAGCHRGRPWRRVRDSRLHSDLG
jgi:2-hydroxychromene-2-carboxylate isomerase